MPVSILPQTPMPLGPPHSTEQSSVCCPEGPCHLSVHTALILTCIPSSQGQKLNLHLDFPSVSQPAAIPVSGTQEPAWAWPMESPLLPTSHRPPSSDLGSDSPSARGLPWDRKSSPWAELLSPDPKPELCVRNINLWELREQFSHGRSSATNYTKRGFPWAEEPGGLWPMGS